jgi:hypothetical protein
MLQRTEALWTMWLPRYSSSPDDRPWVDCAANAALQAAEDNWLRRFDGAESPSKTQVDELIRWKWGRYPPGMAGGRKPSDN